ncbi:MAG: IPT/TIG domain-containing protein, partial [Ilumatobacteraceae bacterium]
VAPAKAAGLVDVVLTTPGGSTTSTDGFTYVAVPTITSMAPSSGPIAGGTAVTITGTNLTDTKAVMFGDTAGTSITVVSETTITVVIPKKVAGLVDVVLTTPDGSATSTDGFTYVAVPTITSMAPLGGSIAGGTTVTITGTNLTDTKAVMFGGTAGTSLTNESAESIAVVTPAKAAGAVAVVVTGSGGTVTASDAFMFSAAPSISANAASSVVQLAVPTKVDGENNAPTEPDFFALSADSEVVGDVRDTLVRRGRKAVASVIGLLIIVATVGGYAVTTATRQAHKLEPVNRDIRTANEQVLQYAVASDLSIRSFLLSGDRSYISDFEKSRVQLEESIALLEREAVRAADQGLSQMVGNSSAIAFTWLSTFADRVLLVASADTPRGDQLAGGQLIDSLRAVNYSIMTYVEEVNAKAVAVAERVRRQTIAVAAVVILVSFLVVAVMLVKEASDVSYPLINMRRVVNRIYRGDSTTRADELVGPAEIRAVARAVNELAYQQETAHKWVSQFNLAKANFLNTVNHELRTPLTSITGYSEFLGDEGPFSDTERTRMASIINRNAFRLSDLIDNMLTVLRIDSTEVRFKMSTFDIRDVIEESVEAFRALAISNELSIVTDLGDMELIVRADANQMIRVVGNLVSNAVKFSLPGGRIEVSAGLIISAEGKREVAFSVKDSGIGIIDAELPHIGSRFYRSRNAVDAAIPGTGLGLMIVDFIVREHSGSWSLASSESVGTTVEVRLPLTGDAISLESSHGGSAA